VRRGTSLGTVLEVVEAVDLGVVVEEVVVVIVVVEEMVVVVGIVVEDVAAAVAAVAVGVAAAVANATSAIVSDTLPATAMRRSVAIGATKPGISLEIAPTREPAVGVVAVEAMAVGHSREVIAAVETATTVENRVTSAVTVIRNHNVQDEEAPRMTITK